MHYNYVSFFFFALPFIFLELIIAFLFQLLRFPATKLHVLQQPPSAVFHLRKHSILLSLLISKSILEWWFSWSVAVVIPGLPTAIIQGILFYFSPSFLASEIPFLELLFHLRKVHLPGASCNTSLPSSVFHIRCHADFRSFENSPPLSCVLFHFGKLTRISLYPYVLKSHYTVPWHSRWPTVWVFFFSFIKLGT